MEALILVHNLLYSLMLAAGMIAFMFLDIA